MWSLWRGFLFRIRRNTAEVLFTSPFLLVSCFVLVKGKRIIKEMYLSFAEALRLNINNAAAEIIILLVGIILFGSFLLLLLMGFSVVLAFIPPFRGFLKARKFLERRTLANGTEVWIGLEDQWKYLLNISPEINDFFILKYLVRTSKVNLAIVFARDVYKRFFAMLGFKEEAVKELIKDLLLSHPIYNKWVDGSEKTLLEIKDIPEENICCYE